MRIRPNTCLNNKKSMEMLYFNRLIHASLPRLWACYTDSRSVSGVLGGSI